jgi:uncharacterized protein (UPF0276 family)
MQKTLPARAGVCFKPEHAGAVLAGAHSVGWFEVHAENYMGSGGAPLRMLSELSERFPLSLHGVGLSIGGAQPLDRDHLARLRALVERHRPASFSEHLAWSSHEGTYFNDLLPAPLNEATLKRVADHIVQTQDALGMRLLLENPSAYSPLADSDIPEGAFLDEIARRTGCGLLLDLNNVHVSAVNLGFDPIAYLDAFPMAHAGEIHLAGHAVETDAAGGRLLIDSHDRRVDEAVWALYARCVDTVGPMPTLIEWDADLPDWPVLAEEAARVDAALERRALRDVA